MVAPAPARPPNSPECNVAQALADQFLVGVVLGAGDAVGDNGRQQRIDAAEHAQHGRIDQHLAEVRQIEIGGAQLREARSDFTDTADFFPATAQQCEREDRAEHQGDQLRRGDLLHPAGGEPEDRQGDHRQDHFRGPRTADQLRQGLQGAHHPTFGDGLPEEGTELKNDQDEANPAHEARDHRVRASG